METQTQIQPKRGDAINSLLKRAWNFSWFSHCEVNYILQGMKSSVNCRLSTWRKKKYLDFSISLPCVPRQWLTTSNIWSYYKLISYTLDAACSGRRWNRLGILRSRTDRRPRRRRLFRRMKLLVTGENKLKMRMTIVWDRCRYRPTR